jgi:hypothetical protein
MGYCGFYRRYARRKSVKNSSSLIKVAILAGALCLSGASFAEGQADAPRGESAMTSVQVTATVTKIDHATREVTIKTDDGVERSFVAGDDVKNLAQVKAGDRITLVYAEALAYEVKKGGEAVAPETAIAGASAEPGAKPAGVVGRQVVVTVKITAIDPSIPSVTFTGPAGNSKTIKVLHPEKLEGVSVGDTVQITYTEALAIKVEEAPKE